MRRLLPAAALLALVPTARAGVVINEILADPSPSLDANCDGLIDTFDDEFVEIVNPDAAAVDLSGWILQDGVPADRHVFASGTVLLPGESIVVFGGGLNGFGAGAPDPWCGALPTSSFVTFASSGGLSLNNAGDTVTLLDPTLAVVDQHTYGSEANADQSVVRDPELVGAFVQHGTVSAFAISPGRQADGQAFSPLGTGTGTGTPTGIPAGTPTGLGGGTPTGAGTPGALAAILVNEVEANPPGADAGYEWIELYNADPLPVDLGGYAIERAKTSWSARYTIPGPQVLQPGERLVIGEQYAAADLNLPGTTLDFGNATSSGDAIRVVDPWGRITDTLIYGPNNADGFLDDTGAVATSLAPSPPEGSTLSRIPDGVDSDDSGVDFQLGPATPGAPNQAGTGTGTGTGTGGTPPTGSPEPLVINELLPNPAGSDGGQEWIEIRNNGTATVDLLDWTIERATSSFSTVYTFPSWPLAPGDHVWVGESAVYGADLVHSGTFGFGNASGSGDAVRLVDPAGRVADTVIYGPDNSDGFLDDTGSVATSWAPTPAEDFSLARVPDGADTDDSGVDFVAGTPSPGLPNPDPLAGCQRTEDYAGVKLNELMSNPDGADDGLEWIELYHAGSTAVDLSGWSIEGGTQSFATELVFDGVVLQPGAYLLIGGALVPGADVLLPGDLPNGSTSSDGLRIVDCAGTVVDTVIYGEPNDTGFVDDTGQVATLLAPAAPSGGSIQRLSDGYDTDDNAADWVVQTSPTPGAANEVFEPVVCVPSEGGVVINEFLPNPAGSDADADAEWVELYNASAGPVRLDGWQLSFGSKDFDSIDVVLPGGVEIAPGAFYVIGGPNAPVADYTFSVALYSGSGGDGIRLYDCVDAVVDTVVYGDENVDGLPDDASDPGVSVGDPDEDQSVARVEDGVDTDAPEDWRVLVVPTPGAPNVIDLGPGGGDPIGSRGCGCGGPRTDAPDGREPGQRGCATLPAPITGFAWVLALAAIRRRRGPPFA